MGEAQAKLQHMPAALTPLQVRDSHQHQDCACAGRQRRKGRVHVSGRLLLLHRPLPPLFFMHALCPRIKAFMRRVHALLVDALSNPFHASGVACSCSRFICVICPVL